MNTIVIKSTQIENAGASQSMDVKKCNLDNASQTSRFAWGLAPISSLDEYNITFRVLLSTSGGVNTRSCSPGQIWEGGKLHQNPEAVGVWKPRQALSEDEKVRTGIHAQTTPAGMFKVPSELFRRPWLPEATSTLDSLIKNGFRQTFTTKNVSIGCREPDGLKKKFDKKKVGT